MTLYLKKAPHIVRAKIQTKDNTTDLLVYFSIEPEKSVLLFSYHTDYVVCSPCDYLGMTRREAIEHTMSLLQQKAS